MLKKFDIKNYQIRYIIKKVLDYKPFDRVLARKTLYAINPKRMDHEI